MSDSTEFINRVREALDKDIVTGDGHTIFNVEFYAPHFTEAELTEAGLVQTFESNLNDHKSTIYDNEGQVLRSLTGVYNLNFLYWVARKVGVTKHSDKGGRGSIARDLRSFINEVVNPVKETV